MGESAGGNYVVALTARLKAKGKGLPYKIVGFSSFLAMLEEGESYICYIPMICFMHWNLKFLMFPKQQMCLRR